jgi:hypothetical protein
MAAASAAFSRRRTQRASTACFGLDGLEIIVIQDLRDLIRLTRRVAFLTDFGLRIYAARALMVSRS